MGGAQPLLLTRTYPAALACPHGPPQALLAPDTACALAVDPPALAQQDLMRGLPTPPRMLPAISHRRAARRCSSVLGDRRGLRSWSGSGRPRGTHGALKPRNAPAGPHGPATALRGQNFPSANSLSMSISNACSATSFFNRWFSASSVFRRLASSAFIPP